MARRGALPRQPAIPRALIVTSGSWTHQLRACVRRPRLGRARPTGERFDGYYRAGPRPGSRDSGAGSVTEAEPCARGRDRGASGVGGLLSRRGGGRASSAHAIGRRGRPLAHPVTRRCADYPTDTAVSGQLVPVRLPVRLRVADALQNLEVLAELGTCEGIPGWRTRSSSCCRSRIRRVDGGTEHPYRGRLWTDVDAGRGPSKWVTLRACRVLKATLGRSCAAASGLRCIRWSSRGVAVMKDARTREALGQVYEATFRDAPVVDDASFGCTMLTFRCCEPGVRTCERPVACRISSGDGPTRSA